MLRTKTGIVMRFCVRILLLLAGVVTLAIAAPPGTNLSSPELGTAMKLLAGAEFRIPAEVRAFWFGDDGLPDPGKAGFAREAARFLDDHPIPPPEKPGKTCAALAYGGDLFLFSYDGPAEMVSGDVRFDGTALLLGPNRADMVDGKSLTIGGRQIFSTKVPRATVSVPRKGPGDEARLVGSSLRSRVRTGK